MRTMITLYGEIAGLIWMPGVESTKAFDLELTRIPRTGNTRTDAVIASRSMEITCLRDALAHLLNNGGFQSFAISWAGLEVSHFFDENTEGNRTVKTRTRIWELHGYGRCPTLNN
jgi:hypothetical protein